LQASLNSAIFAATLKSAYTRVYAFFKSLIMATTHWAATAAFFIIFVTLAAARMQRGFGKGCGESSGKEGKHRDQAENSREELHV